MQSEVVALLMVGALLTSRKPTLPNYCITGRDILSPWERVWIKNVFMLIIAIWAFSELAKLHGYVTSVTSSFTWLFILYFTLIWSKLKYVHYSKSHGIQQKLATLCCNCFSPTWIVQQNLQDTNTHNNIISFDLWLEQQSPPYCIWPSQHVY
jgi:hypothetical protein